MSPQQGDIDVEWTAGPAVELQWYTSHGPSCSSLTLWDLPEHPNSLIQTLGSIVVGYEKGFGTDSSRRGFSGCMHPALRPGAGPIGSFPLNCLIWLARKILPWVCFQCFHAVPLAVMCLHRTHRGTLAALCRRQGGVASYLALL